MKNLIVILTALLILLSGMHLSLAMHFCGGEISEVKFTFTHENAACGSCIDNNTDTGTSFYPKDCCQNEFSSLVTDSNYQLYAYQLGKPEFQLLQVFDVPKTIGIHRSLLTPVFNTNVHPPGYNVVSDVKLPYICVFLI